jgi:hypothetical protein
VPGMLRSDQVPSLNYGVLYAQPSVLRRVAVRWKQYLLPNCVTSFPSSMFTVAAGACKSTWPATQAALKEGWVAFSLEHRILTT